jgi:putative hydrolase of the HAD superfamily
MAVRAITVDFWCTLFHDANSEPRQMMRVEALSRAAAVSQDEAASVLKNVWAEFTRCHQEQHRTMTPADAVRLATEALGVRVEPARAEELEVVFATAILVHPPEPIEGALEAARTVSRRYRLGLISDTGVSPGSSLRALLDRHGFTECFSVFTFSDQVGVSKPERPMFETTALLLGVRPEELLHIGDLEQTDIAGAKAIGARAALFLGDHKPVPNHTRADYVINSWREFLDLLPRLTA